MQYIFDLAYDEQSDDDFIITYCNFRAYKLIEEHDKWPGRKLMVIGPKSSGKTHLANLLINKGGIFVNTEFKEEELERDIWIIDDIELMDEISLFHRINIASEYAKTLLLTSHHLPQFNLKDLQSRINAVSKVLIKNPDDELLKALLLKHFKSRQLIANKDVIDYILTRTQRSFSYILEFVYNIDRLSLEEKRNITIHLVKKVIQTHMPQNLADEFEE